MDTFRRRRLPAGRPGTILGWRSPSSGMLPRKALLVSLPLALGSGWALVSGSSRLEALRAEMARLEEAGRVEGESYVQTLEGAHADRQLEHFDRRRQLALEQAAARRDLMLGVLGLVGAALVLAGGRVLGRIAAEVEEERRGISGDPGSAPGDGR